MLAALKRQGMSELAMVDPFKVTHYWMKNTGVSVATERGVPEPLINGIGRWLLLSKRPPEMVRAYHQSSLRAKLSCSDSGAPWRQEDVE